MRQVNTRKSSRGKASKPGRRSAPQVSRGTGGRRVRRDDDEGNAITGIYRGLRARLSFRRPMIWMTGSVLGFAIVAGVLAGGYPQRTYAAIGRSMDSAAVAAGFAVGDIEIAGAHRTSAADIRKAVGFQIGDSMFAIDAEQARADLRKLPWVEDAVVHKRYPGTVAISIAEKLPFAVWVPNDRQLFVIARSGEKIMATDGTEFRQLPHFFGAPPEGAAELVDAIATHRAIAARIRGMQRISGRRWNLLLDGGVLVDLPEANWPKQLDELEHLIVDKGVLEHNIREIDLRTPANYIFIMRDGGEAARLPKGDAT
ncbi:MAG: FtsQ-type POTRA domain-containing protein [Rhizomicrobium sp.]